MPTFTVTETAESLTENPAHQNREFPVAVWTLGAEDLGAALRVVGQTLGEAPRDVTVTPAGFEVWVGRWRDLDGYKRDEYRVWRVTA